MNDKDSHPPPMEEESQKENEDQEFESICYKMKQGPDGLKNTLHGISYQQALINLLVVTSYYQLKKNWSFFAEDKAFPKFDDSVLEHADCILFCQAKHQKNKTPYSVHEFTNKTLKKVNLAEYFDSYANLKKKFETKKLIFIFVFNSGFDSRLINCTEKVSDFSHDKTIFQGLKGTTRKFNFEKNTESEQTKKEFTRALKPAVKMYLIKRKTQVEVQLPDFADIRKKTDIAKFINTLYTILERSFSNSTKVLTMEEFKSFSKYLFLSLLDLDNEDPEKDEEEIEKKEIQVDFTEDFIYNKNLKSILKEIRDGLELKNKTGSKLDLETILQSRSVKLPANSQVFQLKTVIDPKAEGSFDGDFSTLTEATEGNKSKIICSFGSEQDQFLLSGVFHGGKKSGRLIFEDCGYQSELKTRIYEKFLKIFAKRVHQNSKEEADFKKEYEKHIREFFDDLYFKIDQPKNEFNELSYEKIKKLTDISSSEIHQIIYLHLNEWLGSSRTDLKGKQFDKDFQRIKMNGKRFELLGNTSLFIQKCEPKLSLLKFSCLHLENRLKKFLNKANIDTNIFIFSEEGLGSSQLCSYKVISKILQTQNDQWTFIDIETEHFQFLFKYLLCSDLQYIIIDISLDLREAEKKRLELRKILDEAHSEKKKVILLNNHPQKETQDENLQLIEELSPKKFDKDIAPKLKFEEIKTACNSSEKEYLLIEGKYFALNEALADATCGLYHAISHPEYLYQVLKECTSMQQEESDHASFYIEHQIIQQVPVYKLETVLKETSARIIWFKSLPANLRNLSQVKDLLKECQIPQDKSSEKNSQEKSPLKKQERSKRVEFYALQKTSSIEELLKDEKKTVILEIEESIYKKNEKKILVVHYNNRHELQNEHLVEIEDQNDFMESIKPTFFVEISQINNIQHVSLNGLLTPPPEKRSGTLSWIQGDAGMGKTYLSDKLHRLWKPLQKDFYQWVFKFDLTKIDYNTIAQNTKLEDFLSGKEKRCWMNATLQHDKQTVGGILLLLDAWDEVKPHMYESVKKFFEMIPSTVSVIIMSRPYGMGYMDLDKWENRYLVLKPFDENGIKDYVTEFFQGQKLKEFSEKKRNELGEEIFKWSKDLGSSFSQVMGIPLQIFQLCETLLPKIKSLDEQNKNSELNISTWFNEHKPVNLASLYEKFIFTGFQKFSQIEYQDPRVLYDFWSKYFDFLSIQAYYQLFGKNHKFIIDYHKKNVLSNESKELLLKTGFIKSIDVKKDQVEFAHQTYKEYFGALYILKSFFEKEQSKIYEETLKDLNNNKYFTYYRIVFVFAFQIGLTYHPTLPQFSISDDQRSIINELWRALREQTRDIVGRASLQLLATCFSPLTKQQLQKLCQLLPRNYHKEIDVISQKSKSLLLESLNLKKCENLTQSVTKKENLDQKGVNSKITIESTLSVPGGRCDLIKLSQRVLQGSLNDQRGFQEDLEKMKRKEFNFHLHWRTEDLFQAMSLLGNSFEKEHAIHLKDRIKNDPFIQLEFVVEPLSYLFKICSKETLSELASVILILYQTSLRLWFSNTLEIFLQHIDPLLLIQAFFDLLFKDMDLLSLFATKKFDTLEDLVEYGQKLSPQLCDPINLILSIVYLTKYALVFDEELSIITGERCVSLLKGSICKKQKSFILGSLKGYNWLKHTHAYFLGRMINPVIFDSFCKIPKENIKSFNGLFSDRFKVPVEVSFLGKQDFSSLDWRKRLKDILGMHFKPNTYDYWVLDGGLPGICQLGKYFDGTFCAFLILKHHWENDLQREKIEDGLPILDDDLKTAEANDPHGPQVISARLWYQRFVNYMESLVPISEDFNKWRNQIQKTQKTFEEIGEEFEYSIARELIGSPRKREKLIS